MPKLQEFLKNAEQKVEERRKQIESIQAKIKPDKNTMSTVLNIVLMETLRNDDTNLGLLTLHVGLSGYIDKLQEAINAIQKRLEEISSTKSEIAEIKELAKKHDEMYQFIDKMIQRSTEMAKRELRYVR